MEEKLDTTKGCFVQPVGTVRSCFKAKISPPLLKERVGIFCTRSPHRPNPIGITLAKIERVDMRKRTVFISGVDLLDETPVLDIKPYIATYDSLPDAQAADWVSAPQPPIEIQWESDDLIPKLHKLAESSVHYRSAPNMFVSAIEEVLQVDVRSKYQTKRWTSPDYINYQILDNVRVQYRFALVPQASSASASDSGSNIDTARIEIFAVEKVGASAQIPASGNSAALD
ncbi:hypothetical protein BBO99_00002142 [Phytophthora kernoviae]|uniref:TsaA-like domain-containing protein n=2 Tax=Phytophthora kernoviae TaxID=325452 RepID=A0A3R7G023_9STRA|nr:hypothetical protein G195_003917 [Phytophthora kernoviae 00238/432]KAG2523735.1 hypothetical protein JM16_004966 [Phytophthora kernoviae]KAG2525516.1 hypothetical protein JM18_004885 [Phytophthora kernoviae]RLN14794.1 hypothetical protein BBI17_002010 [Phytophthora kernoviae]RLN83460.1 hypothetical protein BBO99_00002142 [Phytophthora kernoviae]